MKPDATPQLLPPMDVEAERATVGSLFLCQDRAVYTEIRAIVRPCDFAQADYGIICGAIYHLLDNETPVDVVTLKSELARRGLYNEVGGKETLIDVMNSVPSYLNGAHYAAIVRELAQRRELIRSCDSVRAKAMGTVLGETATDIIDGAMKSMADILENGSGSGGISLADSMIQFYDSLEKKESKRLSLGYTAFDEAGLDIGMGEMMIVGARPSMGKSMWAKQTGAQVGYREPVILLSVEERREKITHDLASHFANVANTKMHPGNTKMDADEWKATAGALTKAGKCNLTIIDNVFELRQIKAAITCAVARHKAKLVIIDHMHRIQCWGKTPYERASTVSFELSKLFKELGVAGIVLAQLNRDGQRDGNRRPTMTDLRESGQIEQDADVILLLHREDYYRSSEPGYSLNQVAEFIVAKFRGGERGKTIRLKSYLSKMRFEELDQQTLIQEQLP